MLDRASFVTEGEIKLLEIVSPVKQHLWLPVQRSKATSYTQLQSWSFPVQSFLLLFLEVQHCFFLLGIVGRVPLKPRHTITDFNQ